MSVSDFPCSGNDGARPRLIASAVDGVASWWCALKADDDELAALDAWLSEAERTRAARFGNELLSRRYRIGRASLRWVLAQRLGAAPGQVPIERGARGRPRLAGRNDIDFNISHTRDVALIGVVASAQLRVGVDVEHVDRALNHAGLARKYLTPREQATIAHCDADARRRAFLRYWTFKEAMSKATGDALVAPMRRLEVELAPAVRLVGGPAPYLAGDWTLAAAAVPGGHYGAIALWRTG